MMEVIAHLAVLMIASVILGPLTWAFIAVYAATIVVIWILKPMWRSRRG